MQTLDALFTTIQSRKGDDASTSYTAKLLSKGPVKCAEKFGEEAIETVSAGVRESQTELVSESADMLYHWLVMLAANNITPSQIMQELERREGTSGLTEKANRGQTT